MRFVGFPGVIALLASGSILLSLSSCAENNGGEGGYTSEVSQGNELTSNESDLDGLGSDDPETELQAHGVETRYYNPKTDYSSSYELDVEYGRGGEVERIEFPNGGWEDDFVDQRDNGDGTATVTDEDGREFTVDAAE